LPPAKIARCFSLIAAFALARIIVVRAGGASSPPAPQRAFRLVFDKPLRTISGEGMETTACIAALCYFPPPQRRWLGVPPLRNAKRPRRDPNQTWSLT